MASTARPDAASRTISLFDVGPPSGPPADAPARVAQQWRQCSPGVWIHLPSRIELHRERDAFVPRRMGTELNRFTAMADAAQWVERNWRAYR